MGKQKLIIGPMRVPFLLLTPACVLLGVATAVHASAHVSPLIIVLAFLGALAAHISVNAFNEYFDFKSGLDFKTSRTPFSGGSGTLPENPGAAKNALIIALITSVFTVGVGIYFIVLRGWLLLPIGAAGLILVIFYTIWFTQNPLLCLIAPGLGFGTLMVMGTHFVLAGSYSLLSFVASFVPFFLVSNLLLLNQFPDVEPDREVGRRHLPIIIGRKRSSLVYGAFMLLTYLTIIGGVLSRLFPPLAMLGLLTLPVAVATSYGAYRFSDDIAKLMPFMGLNVFVVILTPVLVAIGFLLG